MTPTSRNIFRHRDDETLNEKIFIIIACQVEKELQSENMIYKKIILK